MFLDEKSPGEPWENGRTCRSCRSPIAPGEPVEELRFESDSEHRLEELNGAYHAQCARPFLSIKRAFDMLGRHPFG